VSEDQRIFGLPEVDDALWPALPTGWLALLSGHSGTGAPLLAKQFAHAGVGSVPVLFYTTYEGTEDVTRAFEDFGWDPGEIKVVNLADEYFERVLVHGLDIARAREKGIGLDELVGARDVTFQAKSFSLTNRMLSELAEMDHPFRLVLDSVDFFLEVLEPHDVTTVARQIRHRCRSIGGQALLTAHSLVHDRTMFGLLHDLSDLTFELKSDPDGDRFRHTLLVDKVANHPELGRIQPIHIGEHGWMAGADEPAKG
jgi:KaiC/GvpD/RAD55 family RecA-like ATPase